MQRMQVVAGVQTRITWLRSRRSSVLHRCVLAVVLGWGIALCATATAYAGSANATPARERRFTHTAHAAALQQAGRPAAECASCHKQSAAGEPLLTRKREHARCFEGCHTFTTSCATMAAGEGNVCAVCHPNLKANCLPASRPPQTLSFDATFSHATHVSRAKSAGALCANCHPVQALAVGKPAEASTHRACSGCHERGAEPYMKTCTGCHVPWRAMAVPPAEAPNPYRLAGFDHRRHARAANQTDCLRCHTSFTTGLAGAAAAQATANAAVPRPTMNACQQACHNGRNAFAATGTACTLCHRPPAASMSTSAVLRPSGGVGGPLPVANTRHRFVHARHEALGVAMDCAQCHQLTDNGQVGAPGQGRKHAPCANSGCHEAEFMRRDAVICVTCHVPADANIAGRETAKATAAGPGAPRAVANAAVGGEPVYPPIVPWQKPQLRALPVIHSEWPSAMNHVAHVGAANDNAVCAGCHGDMATSRPAAGGHAACVACHLRPAVATMPALANCTACHGKPTSRPPVSPWSVRVAFRHQAHGRDPSAGGAATACVSCHSAVAASTSLRTVTPPTMQSCDRCHNGRFAFKTTGFDCVRCHTTVVPQ